MASVIRFAQSCGYDILCALWQTLFIPLFKVLWRVVFSLVGRVVMLYSVFCGCVISLWESCGKCYSLFSCLAVISFLCLVIISFCKSCGQRLADYALLCVELHFSSFVGCCWKRGWISYNTKVSLTLEVLVACLVRTQLLLKWWSKKTHNLNSDRAEYSSHTHLLWWCDDGTRTVVGGPSSSLRVWEECPNRTSPGSRRTPVPAAGSEERNRNSQWVREVCRCSPRQGFLLLHNMWEPQYLLKVCCCSPGQALLLLLRKMWKPQYLLAAFTPIGI